MGSALPFMISKQFKDTYSLILKRLPFTYPRLSRLTRLIDSVQAISICEGSTVHVVPGNTYLCYLCFLQIFARLGSRIVRIVIGIHYDARLADHIDVFLRKDSSLLPYSVFPTRQYLGQSSEIGQPRELELFRDCTVRVV